MKKMQTEMVHLNPDYGFDGLPFGVAMVCLVGLVCFGGGVALITFPAFGLKIVAFVLMLCGLLMVLVSGSYLYHQARKLHRRDKMLSTIIGKEMKKSLISERDGDF